MYLDKVHFISKQTFKNNKMIQKLRAFVNSTRLNYLSSKRKNELASSIDPKKVAHLNKTVACDHQWYGNSYGGFFINPSLVNSDSIVYSIGIGKDISFDKMCLKNHNCQIFAFDPTPKSIHFIQEQNLPVSFKFFPFGISDSKSGTFQFYLPTNPRAVSGSLVESEVVDTNNAIDVEMKTFDDMVAQLGHKHIDVLKMDIEGSEYAVLEKILESDVTIDQMLIEFHDRLYDEENYKSKDIVAKMKAKGYEIFAFSSSYEEISFIHKSKL